MLQSIETDRICFTMPTTFIAIVKIDSVMNLSYNINALNEYYYNYSNLYCTGYFVEKSAKGHMCMYIG